MSNSFVDDKHHDGSVSMIETTVINAPIDPNEERNISIIDSIKAHPKVLMYSAMMCIGPLIFGFDNIIVGVSSGIPSFQITYGELLPGPKPSYIIPSIWLALWNAFSPVGAMVGAAVNGPLMDRFGRKLAFLVGGMISCIAVAIIYCSDLPSELDGRRGTYLAGKIVLGFAIGILTSTCQTYISEIAPPRLRGPLLSIYQFWLVIGQLIGVVVVASRITIAGSISYRVAFASQWAFTGIAILVALVVPESPAWCVKRNKLEKARKALIRLHDSTTVESSIAALQATMEHERLVNGETISYLECFKGTNWRRTRIALEANAVQQFLGISLVANGVYFMEVAGLSPTKSFMILEVGVALGLPANIISWFTMTILGRRNILLTSSLWVAVCWLSIGIAGCFNGTTALWYIGIMLNLIIFFFGLGVGGTYSVVATEVSSVRLRAKTNGLGFMMNGFSSWLFSFFIPYLFNPGKGNANWGGKCGFFFCGLTLVAVAVMYLEFPEMKNRTYREIDEMFEARLKTRDFKHHVCVQNPTSTPSNIEG